MEVASITISHGDIQLAQASMPYKSIDAAEFSLSTPDEKRAFMDQTLQSLAMIK
jgi:hypothetical protein